MRLVQERKNLKLRQQPATLCMGLRGVFLAGQADWSRVPPLPALTKCTPCSAILEPLNLCAKFGVTVGGLGGIASAAPPKPPTQPKRGITYVIAVTEVPAKPSAME